MELCCRESKSEDMDMNQDNYFSYLNLKKSGSTLDEKCQEEVITVRRTRRVLYKCTENNGNKQKGGSVGNKSEVEEKISCRKKKQLLNISIPPNNEMEKNQNNFEKTNLNTGKFEELEEQELSEYITETSEKEYFNGFSNSDRRQENSNCNPLSETEVFLESLKLKKIDISPDKKQAVKRPLREPVQHILDEVYKYTDFKNIPCKKRKIVQGFLSPTVDKTTSEFSKNLKEKGFLNEEFKVEIGKVSNDYIPRISENSYATMNLMHTPEITLSNISPLRTDLDDEAELIEASENLHLYIPKSNNSLEDAIFIQKINEKTIEPNSTTQDSHSNKNEELSKAVEKYLATQCDATSVIEPKVELVTNVDDEDSTRIIIESNEVHATKQNECIGAILEPFIEVKVEDKCPENDCALEKSLETESLQLINNEDVIPKENEEETKNEQEAEVYQKEVEKSPEEEKKSEVSPRKTSCSLEHVSHTLTNKEQSHPNIDEMKSKLSTTRKRYNILKENILKKIKSFSNLKISKKNKSSTKIRTEEPANYENRSLINPLRIVDAELIANNNLQIKQELINFSEQEQPVTDNSFEMECRDCPTPMIIRIDKPSYNQISQTEELQINDLLFTIRNLSESVQKEVESCNDCQILEVKDEFEPDKEPIQFEAIHYDKTPNLYLGIHIRKYCNFCNVGYINEYSLKKHMLRCKSNPKNTKEDSMRLFYCKYCNFGIASEVNFEKHEETCRKELVCGTSSLSTTDSTKKHSPKKPSLECPLCDYTSSNAGHMTVHRRTHDNVPLCVCDICLKGFSRFDALQRHMFKHMDFAEDVEEVEKDFVCNGGALRTTLKVKIRNKPFTILKYQCLECKYATTVRVSMEQHFNSMHLNIVSFKCSMCPFTTKLKTNLKQHLNWHLREKVYRCSHCPYETINKSYIKKHENQVHLKAISYECNFCVFKTYRKENLKTHINSMHLKAKKFSCDECNYFSYVQSNLIAHVKGIHQGIKRRRK
ncbi:uncharacterized protein LOC123671558 isoform X2 [Harmonia axyridis]|uniref:uncharacterized protein LOC123671558 isoform X2 n=1 Tax=Harmonia axyridis TaxID=115357 RepID=UPI001E2767E3|nr:uncharacterized protein LOC123671558 isoform X2 [Harmonia axyridis]